MEEKEEILIEDVGETPDPSLKSKKIKRIILLLITGIIFGHIIFFKFIR